MARGADHLTPSDVLISAATADAVMAAGKQDFVAMQLERSRAVIMAWGDKRAREFIPLRLVPQLEELGTGQDGWPHITRALAKMQGFELFALPTEDAGAGDWLTKVGLVSTETAEITTKICAALADDQKVCRDDIARLRLLDDVDQLLALALQMRAQMRAVVAGD